MSTEGASVRCEGASVRCEGASVRCGRLSARVQGGVSPATVVRVAMGSSAKIESRVKE